MYIYLYLYPFYKSKLFSFHRDSDPVRTYGNKLRMEDDPNISGLEMFSLQGGKTLQDVVRRLEREEELKVDLLLPPHWNETI